MFSFKTMKSHNALHITHRTIATVSLKERLLHKIPKQIQAVTQSGKEIEQLILIIHNADLLTRLLKQSDEKISVTPNNSIRAAYTCFSE